MTCSRRREYTRTSVSMADGNVLNPLLGHHLQDVAVGIALGKNFELSVRRAVRVIHIEVQAFGRNVSLDLLPWSFYSPSIIPNDCDLKVHVKL